MATERLSMRKTREILRQRLALGRAHRAIGASVGTAGMHDGGPNLVWTDLAEMEMRR